MTILRELLALLGCEDREPVQADPASPPPAAEFESKPSGAPPPSPDIAVTLDGLAAKYLADNRVKLDWRKSVVDLMKALGMDPSIENRRELARELGFTGPPDDSATANRWLHREIMRRVAANGGKVPEELL